VANSTGPESFVNLPYPIVFVGVKIRENLLNNGGRDGEYHHGTDVLSANNPDAGNHLWIYLPGGQVKKLFPLSQHQLIPGLIDTPANQLEKGSVVEPNVSIDGNRIYFSYFHDATDDTPQSYGIHKLSKKGADLYSIDISPLNSDFNAAPETFAVKRLTTRVYDSSGYQLQSDRLKDALNPTMALGPGNNNWGTVYMHPEEMQTDTGLKLVYVSDKQRIANSNQGMSIGDANHTFSLFEADIKVDGSLGVHRQLQYYTTTSALSPNRLRNGIAFSYQATTHDARQWQIQGMDSAGRWYPLIGYGANPEAYHLSTFCVKTEGAMPGDYLISTRYYNQNNEGFGNLWSLNLAKAGLNSYDGNGYWGIIPKQLGAKIISTGITAGDDPSDKIGGIWEGKMTTPACARPNELLFSYSQTSANGKIFDQDGNKDIYRGEIAYRPNLDSFSVMDNPDLRTEKGIFRVVRDNSGEFSLVWPRPVISWQARTGDSDQEFAESAIDPHSNVPLGMPFAEVGTSALYNTDRMPFDCYLGPTGQTPYSPNAEVMNRNQEDDLVIKNTAGLTIVQNQSNFCEYLKPENVLGVSINLTSNRTNMSHSYNPGYETDLGTGQELNKLIGVFSVRGKGDQSFKAMIPAQAPFEMKLLDRKYGMKLLDVRSWHSLKPRETRTDCGGCHQHEEGAAINFEETAAAQRLPEDMVTKTQYVDYNSRCSPILRVSEEPTVQYPEWKSDIWPQFNQFCGTCHDSTQGNSSEAKAIFGFSGEADAYQKMITRNFADSTNGALGSSVFWAARGERTDGRDNTLANYQPNIAQGRWGFKFSAVHQGLDLCDGRNEDGAKWVYKLGTWIDNHMPRDKGNTPYGSKFDSFHPSISSHLIDAQCIPTALRVGFWDDTGTLSKVTVKVQNTALANEVNIPNGSLDLPLSGISDSDIIEISAFDGANNRQQYRTTINELVADCNITRASTIVRSTPEPSPSPTVSPSPSQSPSPSPSQTPRRQPSPSPSASPTVSPSESPSPSMSPTPYDDPDSHANELEYLNNQLVKVTKKIKKLKKKIKNQGPTSNLKSKLLNLKQTKVNLVQQIFELKNY
jgi:hypothetical protein